ncbi:heme lyase CcmF/NrfE family subunit, partial [SAR202 cluster bacterium AC-409-J13_OGT_754m]|nr:heme lyase CcmF/NrfE family subunit [SAR202 cluster bacterium AC-409-J13_OGT_754m]
MGELGLAALYTALGLALYSLAASIIGKYKEYPELIESGVYSTYLSCLSLIISSFCLVGGFITHDFEIAYVYSHSNLAMPKA